MHSKHFMKKKQGATYYMQLLKLNFLVSEASNQKLGAEDGK